MLKKFFALALMLVTVFVSSTAFALSVAYPMDGIYSLQPQCAPGKELSVENHATNWGANVIIDNISSSWRKWKIQRIAGTDLYSIIAVHSNLALDVANARTENGVNIATWPYIGGSQNQFRILDAGNGYYVIQANIGGNFVVDVFYRENRAGANVWSYGFNGTPAQLWKLVKVQNLPTFQPYSKRATQKVTAYVMPDLQARSGDEYVSAGDNVTVLREEGNAIFVRYPVRGGTKERWVNKNDIFKGNNDRIAQQPANIVNHNPQGSVERVESPSPDILHVRGKAYDLDNARGSTRLHVYIGGGAGSGAPSYEIRTDGNSGIFDDTRKVDRTGSQRVYIYALNDYGSGNNVEIWNGEVEIKSSKDRSREGIQKRLMQAVFHTTNGVRISRGGDFDGYIDLKKNYGYIHEGIDLVLAHKAPVYSVISGEVVRAGTGYGNTVAIYDKTNNVTVVYLHFDSVASGIYVGKKVDKNTVIGYQGNKDAPQGSHVHIEIRIGKQNSAATSSNTYQENPDPYPYWDKLL